MREVSGRAFPGKDAGRSAQRQPSIDV